MVGVVHCVPVPVNSRGVDSASRGREVGRGGHLLK